MPEDNGFGPRLHDDADGHFREFSGILNLFEEHFRIISDTVGREPKQNVW